MSKLALLAAYCKPAQQIYVDGVFSVWMYTGSGATQTITNGIDLASKGGMVHTKTRDATSQHVIVTTTLGTGQILQTSTISANVSTAINITSFNNNGYSLGTYSGSNSLNLHYVSWTFRNAPKFYTHSVVVKSAGSNATVDLSSLGTVGMVRVKRTDAAGSWYVWHRSLAAGKLMIGETQDAEATLGHITVSGTTLSLVNGVIADGTYLVEGFAHDTSADGLIQCGSFISTVAAQTISLGQESQYVLWRRANVASDWNISDSFRGFQVDRSGGTLNLAANTSAAEVANGIVGPASTGFSHTNGTAGDKIIYMTIRRPNKPPTSGTQVYNAIARTGNNNTAIKVTGVGLSPDVVLIKRRVSALASPVIFSKILGVANCLKTTETSLEYTGSNDALVSYDMDGISIGDNFSGNAYTNVGTDTYINHFFRRAPGVFDQICYSGTGANKTEAVPVLGVPAELWLVKGRSGATTWVWGSSLLAATENIIMPLPTGKVTDATAWNSTYPTATTLSLGTAAAVNTSTATYVCYLWATLAGISKVFTYSGNGTSLTVNCGFSSGARFVMIIRTTATAQDIFIFDTARGIVAGNDPHLSLNTTAAEVTTDDSIDPDASGFIVNQLAATNINVNGAVYIGLAIA